MKDSQKLTVLLVIISLWEWNQLSVTLKKCQCICQTLEVCLLRIYLQGHADLQVNLMILILMLWWYVWSVPGPGLMCLIFWSKCIFKHQRCCFNLKKKTKKNELPLKGTIAFAVIWHNCCLHDSIFKTLRKICCLIYFLLRIFFYAAGTVLFLTIVKCFVIVLWDPLFEIFCSILLSTSLWGGILYLDYFIINCWLDYEL